MAEGLTELWKKLSLTEKEECCQSSLTGLTFRHQKNVLVGRFVSKQPIRSALKRIWKLDFSLKVSTIGEDVFVFEFGDITECNKILHKQSWKIKGALLIFKRLEGDKCPMDLVLNLVPFWIPIHGLNFNYMT